jgi:hypothetical protein
MREKVPYIKKFVGLNGDNSRQLNELIDQANALIHEINNFEIVNKRMENSGAKILSSAYAPLNGGKLPRNLG